MQRSRDRLRFAALGRTQWLFATIEALAELYEPVLVATAPAAPEYEVGEGDFAALAARLGARFYTTTRGARADLHAALEEARPDVGVSVNWPYLLPAELIATVPKGILNAHAGDLPRFRGNAAPNWAILTGEKRVVLTIHEMTSELDAGSIHAQESMTITDRTYIGDVYRWMSIEVPRLMLRALRALEEGNAHPRPQPDDPAQSLRGFPRIPEDGLIDWAASAQSISRLVRASAEPLTGAYTYLRGERLTVWRARNEALSQPWLGMPGHIANRDRTTGEVRVLTGADVLVLEDVEYQGTRVRPAEVIKSMRLRLGLNVEREMRELRDRVRALENRIKDAGS